MNGELSRVDAEALASAAAAAVAAAVANLPDQGGQHHLSQAQVLALAGHAADQDDPEEFGAAHGDGQAQARKPRKLRKPNDVARCQVDGCGRDLSDAKLYLRRYSVCEPHFKAEWVMLSGGRYRFCQQCNKFQSLDNFAGSRRSCKARSEDRNLRRRKQRTDERALAGDEQDSVAGRLLKGGPPLGALALPSRAALCDNGALRQLGGDFNDASNMTAAQYANQVQQLLLASGGAAAAGLMPTVSGGLGASVPGADLAAALCGGVDLSGLGTSAQGANALQLLSAAVAANGAGRGGVGGADPAGNVLQQLQLAQLATALAAKGGGAGGAGGGGNVGLVAPLGGPGLNAGAFGGGLNGANLAQQLILQQAAAAAAAGAGSGNAASSSTGPMDLQSLMAQQLLQQSTAAGQGGPLLLLSNQNVMLLSLDPLGLLQQQAK